MSKMRVPKMDVVRFKENDVIVASGAIPSLTLFNFANTIKNDGKMTYKGTSYNSTNYNDLITALKVDGYPDWIGENGSSFSWFMSISGLFKQDKKGNDRGFPDGTYIWNSDEAAFFKQ